MSTWHSAEWLINYNHFHFHFHQHEVWVTSHLSMKPHIRRGRVGADCAGATKNHCGFASCHHQLCRTNNTSVSASSDQSGQMEVNIALRCSILPESPGESELAYSTGDHQGVSTTSDFSLEHQCNDQNDGWWAPLNDCIRVSRYLSSTFVPD